MPSFEILHKVTDINLDPKWVDSVDSPKFKSRDRVVDSGGYKYQLVAKKERAFSFLERVWYIFLGLLAVVPTLGLALYSKTISSLFASKETRRFAIPFQKKDEPEKNDPVPTPNKDEKFKLPVKQNPPKKEIPLPTTDKHKYKNDSTFRSFLDPENDEPVINTTKDELKFGSPLVQNSPKKKEPVSTVIIEKPLFSISWQKQNFLGNLKNQSLPINDAEVVKFIATYSKSATKDELDELFEEVLKELAKRAYSNFQNMKSWDEFAPKLENITDEINMHIYRPPEKLKKLYVGLTTANVTFKYHRQALENLNAQAIFKKQTSEYFKTQFDLSDVTGEIFRKDLEKFNQEQENSRNEIKIKISEINDKLKELSEL